MIFGFNIEKIRKDFPVLEKGIIYFDNACMSLKPRQVTNKVLEYYENYPACSGRSAHKLARKVDMEVANARDEVRKLINAGSAAEIVFTRNTTEGINLIANAIGLEKGDEVIISDKEHNSNLIPWLKLEKEVGINLVVVESNEDNTFNLDNLKKSFGEKTRMVSVVQRSNLDGITNPIKEIVEIAHGNGALVLVDGAQSVPGMKINVRDLDVDFLAFSGHKMCGPTGTGVLYGKKELLEKMSQFIVGGETVVDSTYDSYKMEELPMKFEAGLQNYAGIIGLGEAARYLRKVGLGKIGKHETKLNKLMTELLADEEKVEIIGPKDAEKRGGIFSFNIKGMDPHHVSRILSTGSSIMTRSGAHCVHSWFNKKKIKGSVRASLYFYNTEEEVKKFVEEIKKIVQLA